MMFQGSVEGYSIKIKGCFERPLWVFQENVKGIFRKISKGVSRDFKIVFKKFQRCLKIVSSVVQGNLKNG